MAVLVRTQRGWSLRLDDHELVAVSSMVGLELGSGWAQTEREVCESPEIAAAGERVGRVLRPDQAAGKVA